MGSFGGEKAIKERHLTLVRKHNNREVIQECSCLQLLLSEFQLLPALVYVLLKQFMALGAVIFCFVFSDQVSLNLFTNLFIVTLRAINSERNSPWAIVIPLFYFHGFKIVPVKILHDLEHLFDMDLFFKNGLMILVQVWLFYLYFFAIRFYDFLDFKRIVNWRANIMVKLF